MRDLIYQAGLASLGYAAALLRMRRPTIFCFHSVTGDDDPEPGPMAVSVHFIDALARELRRADIPIVSLQDAVSRIGAGDDRPFVVLTFDDGYRDNYFNLFPLMARHGLPFTIFVTTGLVDREMPMWWDVVERLCDGEEGTAGAELTRQFRSLGVGGQRLLVRELAARHPRITEADAYAQALTWPMLREMLASGLLTVGAHTRLHPLLASLAPGEIRRELVDGRARIEQQLDCAVPFLAYPFGQPHEVGEDAVAIARQAGFAAAFTTRARPLRASDAGRPFELPRILLARKAQRSGIAAAYMSGAPARLKQVAARIAAGPRHGRVA